MAEASDLDRFSGIFQKNFVSKNKKGSPSGGIRQKGSYFVAPICNAHEMGIADRIYRDNPCAGCGAEPRICLLFRFS